ncbi:MAG: hypothetical protein ABI167_11275 [Nitrosospira sp.]
MVFHLQLGEFFLAQAMIEKGRKNGAVTLALECARIGSGQQGAPGHHPARGFYQG